MGGGSYSFDTIPDIVAKGGISMKDVDTAVSRILKAKFAMGLFENPYTGIAADKASSVIHTPENIALARQLDTESIVLLENKAATLPLKKSANVAVIGPMAHGYMNVRTILTII
jgi:beta-glucosidase